MRTTGGLNRRPLLVGAAIAGVAVAVGLVVGATRFPPDEREPAGSAGVDADSADGAPRRSDPSSTPTTATTEAHEADDSTAPVTVDVPRSERATGTNLHPAGPPPTAAPSTTAPAPSTDPQAAARRYLVAAESVTGADAGQRHHRAGPYMAPGNPAIASGVLIPDPPPPGHSRTIEVLALAEQARNEDLGRVAYQVTYQRYLSPTIPATALIAEGPPRTTFVVVERQADDHWLVLSQTHQLDPAE